MPERQRLEGGCLWRSPVYETNWRFPLTHQPSVDGNCESQEQGLDLHRSLHRDRNVSPNHRVKPAGQSVARIGAERQVERHFLFGLKLHRRGGVSGRDGVGSRGHPRQRRRYVGPRPEQIRPGERQEAAPRRRQLSPIPGQPLASGEHRLHPAAAPDDPIERRRGQVGGRRRRDEQHLQLVQKQLRQRRRAGELGPVRQDVGIGKRRQQLQKSRPVRRAWVRLGVALTALLVVLGLLLAPTPGAAMLMPTRPASAPGAATRTSALSGDPTTLTETLRGRLAADTVAWAKGQGADTGKLGITGFCWGGRTTWMYTAHNPAVKAAVAWYGPVARSYFAGDKTALDVAASIKAPVLGLYGAADGGIPNDTVEKMMAALKAAGNTTSELVLYPDTPHAFHADYRPSYRAEDAIDGWARLLAWFRDNGV